MQPSASCGINFCVAVIGASDALWDGKQPDGSSDHLTVRWDMTTWHNFEVNGDFFNLGSDGSSPGFDLPAYRQTRYRVPFLLTEWNTVLKRQRHIGRPISGAQLANYFAARKTKYIQSVMYYELDSGDTTFGLMIDGTILKQQYDAFASFVTGHPEI
ncbi:hypothetical protein CBA19CS91_40335 [Paraburkholderia hospita]|nr:hypothetical protein CBA19CS91_40335 [Paraburkholderia hospita]